MKPINVNLISTFLEKSNFGYLSREIANILIQSKDPIFSLNLTSIESPKHINYSFDSEDIRLLVPFIGTKIIYPAIDIIVLPHHLLEKVNFQDLYLRSNYSIIITEWNSELIPLNQINLLRNTNCILTTSLFSRNIYQKYGIKSGILKIGIDKKDIEITKNKLQKFLCIYNIDK